MRISYKVHSITRSDVPITVMHNGHEISAMAPGFVVELISEDEVQGHSFRFVPSGTDDMSMYAPGKRVSADFPPATGDVS
ncbi:hypothetical protein [Rhodopila sp.]|uniref:hypothetical protein n=1 Tax=Rhodopila sp. TaxID=2480087 RepID=UPI003D0C93FD